MFIGLIDLLINEVSMSANHQIIESDESDLLVDLSTEETLAVYGGFFGLSNFGCNSSGTRPDFIVNGDLTETSNGRTFPVRILGFVAQ